MSYTGIFVIRAVYIYSRANLLNFVVFIMCCVTNSEDSPTDVEALHRQIGPHCLK